MRWWKEWCLGKAIARVVAVSEVEAASLVSTEQAA